MATQGVYCRWKGLSHALWEYKQSSPSLDLFFLAYLALGTGTYIYIYIAAMWYRFHATVSAMVTKFKTTNLNCGGLAWLVTNGISTHKSSHASHDIAQFPIMLVNYQHNDALSPYKETLSVEISQCCSREHKLLMKGSLSWQFHLVRTFHAVYSPPVQVK